MAIRESGEDYLETILTLTAKNGFVRSIDVAHKLGYTKPSISRAMSILKQAGYIIIEANGNILLTDKGKQKADDVFERHQLISKYLILTLNVNPEIAEQDACRIEHVISQTTFDLIKTFIQKNTK